MDTADIHAVILKVIQQFKEHGLERTFINFFEFVQKGLFPINNVAFRLWFEVVEWYANENTTTMWYMNKTKSF